MRTVLLTIQCLIFSGLSAEAQQAYAGSNASTEVACPSFSADLAVSSPPEPECANDRLTSYDALLVLAPHPDDETLGFAGLVSAYLRQDKPVEVVVVTDGDAYCEACRFWKSGSVRGPTCGALDLSNLGTAEVDSFAEVRRAESSRAMAILGAGEPTFLGYPDTGLGAAWTAAQGGAAAAPDPSPSGGTLRRSDFSACTDCETCAGGYGDGPETELTTKTLRRDLASRLAAASEGTLIATTHWLDGHGDHAALGHFVKILNAELEAPRAVAYAVIHANTAKQAPHPDCWYPGPAAPICPCALESCAGADPEWLSALRSRRLRPDWPGALPDDAGYGAASHLCLAADLFSGDGATKLAAVRAYESQLGFLAGGGRAPAALGGIIDCNGYLLSFVRRTEAFVLQAGHDRG